MRVFFVAAKRFRSVLTLQAGMKIWAVLNVDVEDWSSAFGLSKAH